MRGHPLRPVDDLKAASRRKGSVGQTFKAVAWAFFGVRKSADYERDVSEINPVHVVIAGILGALAFIGVLLMVASWASGGAPA